MHTSIPTWFCFHHLVASIRCSEQTSTRCSCWPELWTLWSVSYLIYMWFADFALHNLFLFCWLNIFLKEATLTGSWWMSPHRESLHFCSYFVVPEGEEKSVWGQSGECWSGAGDRTQICKNQFIRLIYTPEIEFNQLLVLFPWFSLTRSQKMERHLLWRSMLHGKCWPHTQMCWRSKSRLRSMTSLTTRTFPWTGCLHPSGCRITSCTPNQTISQLPSTRASRTSSSSRTKTLSSPRPLATG